MEVDPIVCTATGSILWTVPALHRGPYQPYIDSEFAYDSPFESSFGEGYNLLTQIELDYELLQRFGTLAVGGTAGFLKADGHGRLASTLQESPDETSLFMVPLSLSLVYRFDFLERRFGVPLVPLVKAGLDYYVWWITNGVGKIPTWEDNRTGDVSEGRGGTFGGHIAVGLAFLLDCLAPDMAQTFDTEIGVNGTYLFAEFVMSWVNDFGVGGSFDLSSKTFMAGITFEF